MNEVKLAQSQFELINSKYEETIKLVGILKKQVQNTVIPSAVPEATEEAPEEIDVVFPLSVPKQSAEPSKVQEMEAELRSKDGKIASLNDMIKRLRQDASHTTDALTDMKVQYDEMEKKVAAVKAVEEEVLANRGIKG